MRLLRAHIGPLGYAITFAALLVLTALTLGLSYVEMGRWHVPVALFIASAKSLLVAFFFMHLVEQRASNRIVAATGIVFVGLLVGLMVVDIDTRSGLEGDVVPRPPPTLRSER